MKTQIISFLRSLILNADVPVDVREKALCLYEENLGVKYSIGGYNVGLTAFNEIMQHIEMDKKIRAIKVFREATGLGLKESKDIIFAEAEKRG